MRIVPSEDYAGHCASAKIFRKRFPKARFGHWMMTHVLKKFSGGGVNLPDFSHVGVRGVWLNVQREFRPGKKFPQVFPKSLIFAIYRR